MSRPSVRTANRTGPAKPIQTNTVKKTVSSSKPTVRKSPSVSAVKDRKIEDKNRKEEVKAVDKGMILNSSKPNLLQRVEEKKQLIKKTTSDERNKSSLKNKIQIKGKTISKSAFSLHMTQPKNLPKPKEFTILKVQNQVFRCFNKPKINQKLLKESTEVTFFACVHKVEANIEIVNEVKRIVKQESYRCISKPNVFMVKYRQDRCTYQSIQKPIQDIVHYQANQLTLSNSYTENEGKLDALIHIDQLEFSEKISNRDSMCLDQNQPIFNETSVQQNPFHKAVSENAASIVNTPLNETNSDYLSLSIPVLQSVPSSIQTSPSETPLIDHKLLPERFISFDDFISSISTDLPRSSSPIQNSRFSLRISIPKEKIHKVISPVFKSSTSGFIFPPGSPKFSMSRSQDLLGIKFEISKREEKLNRRRKAAVRIQACYRAWKVRKDYIKIKLLEKELKFTQQLEELKERIALSWAPVRIYNAIKAWRLKKRLERAQIFEKFLLHCAEMIQKFWRGYQVRRIYGTALKKITRAKQLRIALIKGWKIRSIFKTKTIRTQIADIRDLQLLTYELSPSSPASISSDLLYKAKAQAQLPEVISKFKTEIQNLYNNGSWIQYRIPSSRSLSSYEVTPCSPKLSDNLSFGLRIERFKTAGFDEEPIRPLYKDTIQIPEEAYESAELPNIKKFTFLKRNKEIYNARSSSLNTSKKEIKNIRENKKLTGSTDYKELSKEIPQEISTDQNDSRYEEPKNELNIEKKPFNFLKRRSQKMQPKKIKWNVAKKIDCWGSKTLTEPRKFLQSYERAASTEPIQDTLFQLDIVRPKQKHARSIPSRSGVPYKTLEELEYIFLSIRNEFKPVWQFFSSESRCDETTEIPQISRFSNFFSNISEYKIQKLSRDLEQKYLQLSSDEELL